MRACSSRVQRRDRQSSRHGPGRSHNREEEEERFPLFFRPAGRRPLYLLGPMCVLSVCVIGFQQLYPPTLKRYRQGTVNTMSVHPESFHDDERLHPPLVIMHGLMGSSISDRKGVTSFVSILAALNLRWRSLKLPIEWSQRADGRWVQANDGSRCHPKPIRNVKLCGMCTVQNCKRLLLTSDPLTL